MSGVYIKGMEMPSCCGECRFLSEYGDYPVCIITDEQRGYNFRTRELRMPHCPLVPVPPHGDLIDRDKLEKDIDNYIGGEESRSRFHHWVQVQSVVIPGNKGAET